MGFSESLASASTATIIGQHDSYTIYQLVVPTGFPDGGQFIDPAPLPFAPDRLLGRSGIERVISADDQYGQLWVLNNDTDTAVQLYAGTSAFGFFDSADSDKRFLTVSTFGYDDAATFSKETFSRYWRTAPGPFYDSSWPNLDVNVEYYRRLEWRHELWGAYVWDLEAFVELGGVSNGAYNNGGTINLVNGTYTITVDTNSNPTEYHFSYDEYGVSELTATISNVSLSNIVISLKAPEPAVLFTQNSDVVNFGALSAAQVKAIEEGVQYYDALAMHDVVVLPDNGDFQLSASKFWDPEQVFFGNSGNDKIYGGTANDIIDGGIGNDVIRGNDGNDSLSGGANNDTITGGVGHDTIDGGIGNDTLQGDAGYDNFLGGPGNDSLFGGAGDDLFSYTSFGAFAKNTVQNLDGGAEDFLDVLYLSGSPDDYTFTVTYGANWSSTINAVENRAAWVAAPAQVKLNSKNIEWVLFDDPIDNAVTLHQGHVATEMLRLASEVYGLLRTLGHTAEPLAQVSKIVPTVAAGAIARLWHPVAAMELNLKPADYGNEGTLHYSFSNGFYAAYDTADVKWVPFTSGDQPEANALVLSGLVKDKRTLAISFRGTDQKTDFNDYLNFETHYEKFRPLLDALKLYVADPENGIQQILVSGHSLGGGVLQHFLHEFPDTESYEVRGYTDGSPGSEAPTNAPTERLVNYAHTDDPVPKLPGWLIGNPPGNLAQILGADPKTIVGANILINSEKSNVFNQLLMGEHDSWLYLADAETLHKFATDPDNKNSPFFPDNKNSPFFVDPLAVSLREEKLYVGKDIQLALGTDGADLIHSESKDNYVLGGNGDDTFKLTRIWPHLNAAFADGTQLSDGSETFFRLIDGGIGFDTVVVKGIYAGTFGKTQFDLDWYGSNWGTAYRLLFNGTDEVAVLYRVEELVLPRALLPGFSYVVPLDGNPVQVQTRPLGSTSLLVDPNADYTDTGDGAIAVTGTNQNDNVVLGHGLQKVNAGAGDDSVFTNTDIAQPGDSVSIDGQDGNDYLLGGGGNDTLTGGTGNDDIDGGTGNDKMTGGMGDDNFVVENKNDVVIEASGNGTDTILALASYALTVNVENLTLSDDAGAIDGTGNAGANVILGNSSPNMLSGGAGNDVIGGGKSDDTLIGGAGADVLDGGDGNDTLSFLGSTIGVTLDLKAGSSVGGDAAGDSFSNFENITGGAAADLLTGDDGDNTLDGGLGNDTLIGGDGKDTIIGGAGNDLITGGDGAGDDIYTGGQGIDTVKYTSATQDITIDLVAGTADGPEIGHDLLADIENVVGGKGSDLITGDGLNNSIDGFEGDDTVAGGDGNDTIEGGAGNDQIDGGLGNDTLKGGGVAGNLGNDTISYENATAGVTVSLANALLQDTKGAGKDTISGFENIIGSGLADQLVGDGFANTVKGLTGNDRIFGNAGNDVLEGGDDDDLLEGGLGNDTLAGGAGIDTASYLSAPAGVTVDLSVTTEQDTKGAGKDTLTGIENLIGSSKVDTLTGDDKDNVIEGGAGIDVLDGGNGNDTLSYAAMTAAVVADLGKALLGTGFISTGGDLIKGFENIVGGSGNDTLTGDGGANIIKGGAGHDVINGGAGNDTLFGDAGNDRLIGGAGEDEIDGGDGIDTADYSASAAIAIDLGKNTASGGDADGDTLTSIENITGGAGNDALTGDDLANVLDGGLGDDLIDGGLGNDTLKGGGVAGNLGNDTISYENATAGVTVSLANALLQDTKGAGKDTISGFENIIGSGLADQLVGDGFANTVKGLTGNDRIFGNAGNDVLEGGDDDDLLEGGLGNDTLAGGAGIDTASYLSAPAGVTVDLSVTTEQDTKGAGKDTLTGIENLIGSSKVDTLTGDDKDNVIEGGAGIDVLDGGNGNDTLSYAAMTAAVVADLGKALLGTGFISTGGDLIKGFENIVGGSGNDTLTGDGGANIIKGGAGHDVINGGAGNDTLFGDAGNDRLIGGEGEDEIDGGDGIDTADYSASAAIAIDLGKNTASGGDADGDTLTSIENLTGGSGNDVLTGSDLANILDGGLGDDIIDGGLGNDTLKGGGVAGNLGNDTISYENATAGVTVSLANALLQDTKGAGKDTISGFENLTGSDFVDQLAGDANKNTLNGGNGADTLIGGLSADILTGGADADVFLYGAPGHGGDTVADFLSGTDKIGIVKAGFGIAAGVGLGKAGVLNFENEYFVSGTDPIASKAGHGQFLFDTDSHQLFWDSNGIAANGLTLIATLTDVTSLTAADFELR